MSDCSSCKQKGLTCDEICPVCGKQGMKVPNETVNAMLIEGTIDSNTMFQLCINPACQISYFSCNELFFDLDEVKVPIWFKKVKSKYIICYCRDIELSHVIKAVKELSGDQDINVILKHLKKDHITKLDCLHNNPTGITCEKLLRNAIDYAYKIFLEQSH